ncbi:unnamed protein product [Callosobruchus maculatus]|uniref:Uncharacterized protein n=1 Tax=Callosobruchus maculatus TaxID=64391 RepID=A0A653DAS3_CALMS|nr:unnamed protein product [Callosobruchus maculatus]
MVRAHKSASDGRYGWNGRYSTDLSLGYRTSDRNPSHIRRYRHARHVSDGFF